MIEGAGIIPDIEVAAAAEADTQLERAIEALTIARAIQRRASDVTPGMM